MDPADLPATRFAWFSSGCTEGCCEGAEEGKFNARQAQNDGVKCVAIPWDARLDANVTAYSGFPAARKVIPSTGVVAVPLSSTADALVTKRTGDSRKINARG